MGEDGIKLIHGHGGSDMTEEDELQQIAEIAARPTEDGFDQLMHIERDSKSYATKLKAVHVIFDILFGPITDQPNEEFAVWAEAAGVDFDKLRERFAEFRSKH
jgi:hypothetical protein